MARYLAHPREEEIDLAKVMRALADPVRLRLVGVLGDGEYHPCRVEEFDVGVHKSTLSHHFRILRESGVTVTRLTGRNHCVRLRLETLNKLFPNLIDAVVSALWAEPVAGPASLAVAGQPRPGEMSERPAGPIS